MTALIENRKARFNYEILDTYEAGIELLGHEVKALRNGLGSLEGAHVTVRGNEVFLIGAHIAPYQPLNTAKDYDPLRNRKLLLNKKEIEELTGFEAKKGLTIVPLSVYNKSSRIKVAIATVRGKKKFDKRETIKKREADKEIRRSLKREY